MGVRIEALTVVEAREALPALSALLRDVVDGGASVGFLPPLTASTAAEYWGTVVAAIADGSRVLLVARRAEDGAIVGTAQLDLSTRENGRHRAEVAKVMVPGAAQRQGIGRALMLAAEEHSRRLGRTTLVLDTRSGDPSERLYASLGWQRAGEIPRYAQSAGGRLDASAFYYKLLLTPGG
ncbi:MAG TPA: GNAT family N-acetyltransferase [Methylomirabilota bacterium]|nr:GNAT family N-acetyltransferase [Methylomirabilota bacterium]